MKLVFSPPGPDTPGHLRRMRAALEFKKMIAGGDPQPEMVDALIEFLLPFVNEPQERATAREALWDASSAQFDELLGAITGENENPT